MDALDFFTHWFGEDASLTETISLWEFTADQGINTTYHSTPKAAATAVEAMPETSNVYFGVTLRTPGVGHKAGVRRILGLHADFDFKHFSSEEDAQRVLNGFELEPSIVVHTGGGLHVYWRLSESLEATGANGAYVESLMERLYFRLGGLDKVQNLTRILRVPDTYNQKYKPTRQTRVVQETDRTYSLNQFDAVLPEVPSRALPDRVDVDLTYLPPTEKEIADMLFHLPPEGWDYNDYNNILMAVHSVFPDERGVRLIQNWSPALNKATGEDITAQKFDSYKSQGISVGTLYRFALDNGWKPKRGPRLKIVREGTPAPKKERVRFKPEWQVLLEEMAEVSVDDIPYWLRVQYDYILPVMEAFLGTDWPIELILAFWSSQWSSIKYENLNLSLWFLGLAKQGIGKSMGIAEMMDVYRQVSQLRELDLPLFSSGTTRGLENMFSGGEPRTVMAVIDEFSGFLKAVKNDYSSGLKESMNKIYDGQTFRHVKATEAQEIVKPYLSLIAATTPPAWKENADREDTQNGFLTRMMFSVPNTLNILPRYRFNLDDRATLVDALVDHIRTYSHVTVAVPNTPYGNDPPVLKEYIKSLGLNTGSMSTVEDDAVTEDEIAWGRVVARVKKLAALLALMEETPDVVQNTLLVHERHFALAIRIAHRGAAFQKRALELLGRSKDDADTSKVLRVMKERAKRGITKTDLMRYTHLGKRQIDPVLELLTEDGHIEPRSSDNRTITYYLAKVTS
jgi:hypothetical protein